MPHSEHLGFGDYNISTPEDQPCIAVLLREIYAIKPYPLRISAEKACLDFPKQAFLIDVYRTIAPFGGAGKPSAEIQAHPLIGKPAIPVQPRPAHTESKTAFPIILRLYSTIFPSVEMTTTRHGINFPLVCNARFAACSIPPQHGTSIRTMVRLWILLSAIICVSFSA